MLHIPSRTEYISNLLCLKPTHGWGWRRLDDTKLQVDYELIERAGCFHIRVHDFFEWHDELRGIVGMVEQQGHIFDQMWTSCATMLKGEQNFTDKLCLRYDLHIGVVRPTGEWPEIRSGCPIYLGYGVLAETESHIKVFLKRP